MFKKIIPFILCLIFALGTVSFAAENTNNAALPQAENMQQGGGFNGGMPPDANSRNEEMPRNEITQEAPTLPDNSQQQNDGNGADKQPENAVNEQNDEQNKTQQDNMQQPQGQMPNNMPQGGMGMPDDSQNWQSNEQAEQSAGFSGFVKTYATPITSVILLLLAFVFVKFYRRKNY